ncbi:hypothetical protein DPMN_013196 [Dreissena polymorpha]|uniref:Uncharacterized protein n=1 Tax=Dreissena polymorpha TaxID=45954 RepID=A0A9D4N6Y1_DREPO|nr:hypothetical protein DPMN_013196 [Dreissena polymorpha]
MTDGMPLATNVSQTVQEKSLATKSSQTGQGSLQLQSGRRRPRIAARYTLVRDGPWDAASHNGVAADHGMPFATKVWQTACGISLAINITHTGQGGGALATKVLWTRHDYAYGHKGVTGGPWDAASRKAVPHVLTGCR